MIFPPGSSSQIISEGEYSAICAQVNSGLEINDLLTYLNWYPEKLIRQGDVFITLCPIHQDTIFRTLVINTRNKTYCCKHVHCPGNHPSDYLDLLVKARQLPLPKVLDDVIEHFGPEYFRLSDKQVQAVKGLVQQIRR
jgi:hypothetical protein